MKSPLAPNKGAGAPEVEITVEMVESRRGALEDAFREYLSEYGGVICEEGGIGNPCKLYLMLCAAFKKGFKASSVEPKP